MRSLLFIVALLGLVSAEKWALFISGNSGWRNYCITSTICRGYNLLQDAGVKEDHMVYAGFDDVFEHKSNPYPGQIFTDASEGPGIDYSRCRPHQDYKNGEVSAELFMAIMSGNKEEAKKLVKRENVRVIESSAEDEVFVYYMDHGAIGFCEVGKSTLKDTVLMATIDQMHTEKRYKNLVFYFEACHSGSMFEKLPLGMNVYAFTGSDKQHSAYMNNCPPKDKVDGKSMGTCLGAWYDNIWMQEIDDHGSELTNNQMFQIVHDLTAKQSNQNVSQYGDITTIGEMMVSQFVGHAKPKPTSPVKKHERSVPYEDTVAHNAKWAAIREGKYSNMRELEEIIQQEALNDVTVMRLAIEFFGDEVVAEDMYNTGSDVYNQDCVRDLTLNLMGTCGYTIPLRTEHKNVFTAICSNGYVSPNMKNVC